MLGELLGELIIKPIFEIVCYWTGKPVARLLSLGRLHVSLSTDPDRKGKPNKRWRSVTVTRGAKRYVHPEVVSLVGIFVWVAIITAIVVIVRRG